MRTVSASDPEPVPQPWPDLEVVAVLKPKLVVLAFKMQIPEDWSDEKLAYHLGKGYVALGEVHGESTGDTVELSSSDVHIVPD